MACLCPTSVLCPTASVPDVSAPVPKVKVPAPKVDVSDAYLK